MDLNETSMMDFNKDNIIDLRDVTILIKKIKEMDKTGNGIVNIDDIKKLLQNNLLEIFNHYQLSEEIKSILGYHFRFSVKFINDLASYDLNGDGALSNIDVEKIINEIYKEKI